MMIHRRKFGERVYVICLTVTLLALSYIPVFVNYRTVPADRYYFGGNSFPLDMLGNLTTVREGYLGYWRKPSKVVAWTQHFPQEYKFEYILMGQAARLIHLDPIVMYKVFQLTASISFFCLSYWFLARIFANTFWRVLAYTMVLFSGGIFIPIKNWNENTNVLGIVGESINVFQRFTRVAPHYLLSHILILILLYFLARVLENPKRIGSFIFSTLCGLLIMFLFAPALMVVYLTLPFYICIIATKAFKMKISWNIVRTQFVVLTCFVILTILPIINVQFFQSAVLSAEKVIYIRLGMFHYLLSVGPLFILSLYSLPYVYRSRNTLLLLFAPWVIVHPLMIIIAQQFNLFSSRRVFQTPYVFIFAVLAVYGLINTITALRLRYKKITSLHMMSLFLVIMFLTGSFGYTLSYKFGFNCFCTDFPYPYGHPKKEVMKSIFWLRDASSHTNVVLSGVHTAVLIRAFSGNTVYADWWMKLAMPPNYYESIQRMVTFYSGKMDQTEALRFLQHYNISYILYTDEERAYAGGVVYLPYPFLMQRYTYGGATLYGVQ